MSGNLPEGYHGSSSDDNARPTEQADIHQPSFQAARQTVVPGHEAPSLDQLVERVAKAIWRRNNPQWHSATEEQISQWWAAEHEWKKLNKWHAFAKVAISEITGARWPAGVRWPEKLGNQGP